LKYNNPVTRMKIAMKLDRNNMDWGGFVPNKAQRNPSTTPTMGFKP
jgi:hypothetical protein